MTRYWSRLNLASKVLALTIPLVLAGMGSLTYWLAEGMRDDLQNRLQERGTIIQKQIEVTRGYLASQYVAKIKGSGQGMIKVAQDHSAPDTVPLPATATREMSEELNQLGFYTARIISKTPLNPANSPQGSFEEEGLRALAAGAAESIRVEPVKGAMMFRRMTPDIINSQACIGCHTDKKMGDMVGAISVQMPMEKALAALDHKTNVLYAVGALGAAFLAAIVFLLLRSLVILPLKHLGEAVEKIAQGHYGTRASATNHDEMGQLSQAFNAMGEKLQSSSAKQQEMVGALDAANAAVTMIDRDCKITYVNQGAKKQFKLLEPQLRTLFPGFDTDKLVGTCIDSFHKDPQRIRRLLDDPRNLPHKANIQAGPLTLALSVSAINDLEGKYIGNTLEWQNVTETRKLEVEMARLRSALDSATANMLVCDRNYQIVYLNKSSQTNLQKMEREVQKAIPGFRVDKVLGSSIDMYHKNPSQQRQLLDDPKNLPRTAEIKIGPLTLDLAASAIMNDKGEYLGNVVEWRDVSADKKAQIAVDRLIVAASSGQLGERINAEEFEGFFKNLSQGVNTMLDAVVTPLHEAQTVLTALAQGDLRTQMTGAYEGEFEQMKVSLNRAITNLTATLATVRTAAESVSTGSEEITKGNEDLSQRTSEQASALEETSSAMEQMTSAVKQSADNAKQANQLAIAARNVAEQGGAVTTKAIDAMGEINKSSKKIGDIITVIDEIAFQTNLLALNAAVEAARAGEHGRGFAVVAAEVRNLAQRSATAAKEIKGLINESIQRVTDGSELVDQSGKTLAEIVGSVKRVTDIIAEITASAQEQASGIDQVNKAIVQMDETTQQNAALVEEATSASQSMKEQAKELMHQVASFKLAQTGPEQSQGRPGALSSGPAKKPMFKKPAVVPMSAPEPASIASGNGKDRRQKESEFEEF